MNAECEFCFGEEGVVAGQCASCRAYRKYYDNLSPEERRAEHLAEAQYVQETIDRGDE